MLEKEECLSQDSSITDDLYIFLCVFLLFSKLFTVNIHSFCKKIVLEKCPIKWQGETGRLPLLSA